MRTSGDTAQIRGGALMAQFTIRDELAVEAQLQLDTVARDLIERFETPGLDPTALATDPGLFTDDGNRFDPIAFVGLASRVSVNASVDPNMGGDSWKLRAGLGAVTAGDPGQSAQLRAFGNILKDARPSSWRAVRHRKHAGRRTDRSTAVQSRYKRPCCRSTPDLRQHRATANGPD